MKTIPGRGDVVFMIEAIAYLNAQYVVDMLGIEVVRPAK